MSADHITILRRGPSTGFLIRQPRRGCCSENSHSIARLPPEFEPE